MSYHSPLTTTLRYQLVQVVGGERGRESAAEEIELRGDLDEVNDFHRQRAGNGGCLQPHHELRSFFKAFLENQTNPAHGNVYDPGRSAQLFAGRAHLANRFKPARVPVAGTALGAGAFFGRRSSSLTNRCNLLLVTPQ
jgi:hypothetical protein